MQNVARPRSGPPACGGVDAQPADMDARMDRVTESWTGTRAGQALGRRPSLAPGRDEASGGTDNHRVPPLGCAESRSVLTRDRVWGQLQESGGGIGSGDQVPDVSCLSA